GVAVADIWEAISQGRRVARTTVLTVIQRLEQRGWLRRRQARGATRYVATTDRGRTVGRVADAFIQEFFDGSATELVRSLLGTGRLKPAEVNRLRAMLDEADAKGGRS
ncbi:MAG: BlaI/MecI/CopY family transcriptional regulator, partial [Phycisphaerales bacterium]|nr:BlaI/MecI/CopY family transcriptional regulator [Phycisphaerales bacterium]